VLEIEITCENCRIMRSNCRS